ncbi:MAG: hypothetical protein J5741_04910 [Bacteroidales bacterium]|nr:hypothetical protein [Bacteroidales bacterium]
MLISKQQVSWRYWLVLLLCGMMGWGNAQNSYAEYFPQLVKNNSNQVCPFTTTKNVTCQRATFEDNNLHVYVEVPSDMFPGLSVSQWKLLLADRLRFNFDINSYINPLYHGASDIGAGLVYHIQIKESDRSFNIRYSPSELKKFIAARNTKPYQSISKWQARVQVFSNNASDNLQGAEPIASFSMDSVIILQETETWFFTASKDDVFENLSQVFDDLWEITEKDILFTPDNYDGLVKAEYGLQYLFYNSDHTDSIGMTFPFSALKESWDHARRLVLADDAFMQRYMQEYAKTLPSLLEKYVSEYENVRHIDIYYEDGYTTMVMTMDDTASILQATPDQIAILKQSMLPYLKYTQQGEDEPEIYGDTLVTPELFYQYMKGFRYMYIGENTRKTIDIICPMDEVFAAPEVAVGEEETAKDFLIRRYSVEEYHQLVKDFSNACPVQQGILTFTDAVYQDNYLQLYVTMDSTAKARNDLDQLREIMSLQLSTSYDAILFTKLAELGSGVVFHFQFYDTLAEILYTPQEIKGIYANMGDSLVVKKQGEALLELLVQNMNKECPVFEEGFGTVDSFVLSNQCLIINFTLIEEVADPFFMQGKDNVKDLYRMQFMNGDPSDMALLEMCVDAGYGICYRFSEREKVYTGKKAKKRHRSPRMVKVCFSVDELKALLQEK